MVLLRIKHIYIVIYICTKCDVCETYQNMYTCCFKMRHRIEMKIQLKDTRIFMITVLQEYLNKFLLAFMSEKRSLTPNKDSLIAL